VSPLYRRARLVLPAAVAIAHLLAQGPHIQDDAFISFRYARNLADGAGLVFNRGEVVEGYSNPLWTVVLAAASWLGLDLVGVALVLGGLCFVATVCLTQLAVERATADRSWGLAAGLLTAAAAPLAGSSLIGLETSLFAAGIAACLYGASRPSTGPWFVAGLVVVGTTRPEGPILVVVLLATAFAARRWRGMASPRRQVWVAVAVVGAVVVVRRLAYGHWLPMSALAKRDGDVDAVRSFVRAVPDGARYVASAVGEAWLVIAVVLVAAAVVRWRQLRAEEVVLATSAVVAGLAGVVVALSNGGDWMPFGRLVAPYLPAALAVCVVGAAASVRSGVPAAPFLVAFAALVAVQPALPRFDWVPTRHGYDDLGRAIATADRQDDLVATPVLGRLSYYAGDVDVLDTLGLTEPAIALQPVEADVYGKHVPHEVARFQPALLVCNNWGGIDAFLDAALDPYVALVSESLTEQNIYIAVREDVADPWQRVLAPRFGARLVDADDALDDWGVQAPGGYVPPGGP
jgi:hypothetical protein